MRDALAVSVLSGALSITVAAFAATRARTQGLARGRIDRGQTRHEGHRQVD